MRMEIVSLFLFFLACGTSQGRPLLESKLYRKSTIQKVLHHESTVAASAEEVWQVYSSPELPKHLSELLPGAFEKVEIFGDGGVGTILEMVFPPGEIPQSYKEKFVLIDDERRLKKVEMIEGGYLDMGVTFYMDTIHIVATGCNSCIIKSSTEYYVKPEFADKVQPLITTAPLEAMDEAITKIVLANKNKSLIEI
uniref:Norcoclaurine synthase n=1 Tax=Sinopodophyllum hexandrum TaxID=93608 RepID=A0A097H1C2_SINHE|nr:norcoclaurine synthase [Sinopodophyllum hexandrum]